jgi:hypothetical protein
VYDRVTLATASGLPLVSLAFHVAMGTTALAAGLVAIAARKGGSGHRRSGVIFVYAMIAMGLAAVGIGVYEGKDDVAGGALTAYLVFTAWTTVKPLPGGGQRSAIPLMLFALLMALAMFARGLTAYDRPGHQIGGVPAGMMFFLGTIFMLAVVGDARMIRDGGIQGTRRLARHLWRMCFGLFIATGSFVAQLVQMKFMPGWMRSLPVILFFAAGPLLVLLYWMWRVRLRQNLRGLMTARPIEAPRTA